MSRELMSPAVDRQVFRHTAVNSKKINLEPRMMRGGIRL